MRIAAKHGALDWAWDRTALAELKIAGDDICVLPRVEFPRVEEAVCGLATTTRRLLNWEGSSGVAKIPSPSIAVRSETIIIAPHCPNAHIPTISICNPFASKEYVTSGGGMESCGPILIADLGNRPLTSKNRVLTHCG
jgi:hypothetical protein